MEALLILNVFFFFIYFVDEIVILLLHLDQGLSNIPVRVKMGRVIW